MRASLRRLGDFVLLEEIGRGGMGLVYRARQVSMGRLVALKVLPSFAGMDADAVARFRREAEAAGRLSHPGIVPIYAVGEVDGVHYFAMELVEGPSLHHLLENLRGRDPERLLGTLAEETSMDEISYAVNEIPRGNWLPGARYACSCAAIAIEVAGALAAAHAGKIIHRDLKPSNILFHRSGRPVLADFGLSRDERSIGLTHSGDAVGTPSYMAPEQACGKRDLDARVDVYGIGATLYEMLTLRPPFEGAHAGEIMRKILEEDPVPVRKLNPRVPQDLETIVHTCLAKEPDQRYPAVEALIVDLRAFLEGRPIHARRPGFSERVIKLVYRHPKASMVTAAAVTVTALMAMLWGAVSIRNDRVRGEAELAQARRLLLEEGRPAAAQEAYGKAAILLQDTHMVMQARRRLLNEAWAQLYPGNDPAKHKILSEFLATVPQGQHDAEVLRYARRLAGLGRLVVSAGAAAADARDVQLQFRAFSPQKDLDPDWRPLPRDGELPIGWYLVRSERPGYATVVRAVEVRRDDTTEVPLNECLESAVPLDMVCVVGAEPGRDFAVSRGEMTNAQYAAFLQRVQDPALRLSLTPATWAGGAPPEADLGKPITGLGYDQARAAAAHFDCHLLSFEEFRLAATSGLRDLAYPWGMRFDLERVIGNPNTWSEPVATMLDAGASPAGVHHLSGNVEEILAALPDGRLPVAGGHWLSMPNDLRIPASVGQLTFLEHAADRRNRQAGTRLARFLTPADDPEQQAALDARLDLALKSSTEAALAYRWTVHASGDVELRVLMGGHHGESGATKLMALGTDGFLHAQDIAVRDGEGRHLGVTRYERAAHHESCSFAADFTRRDGRPAPGMEKGQYYRLELVQPLLPASGLRAVGDAYLLQIPVRSDGFVHQFYRVELPAGCRIEQVEPAPTYSFHSGGQPHVAWEFAADQQSRSFPAVIRFRRDGMLTEQWPERGQVERAVAAFFAALESDDPRQLEEVLHPAYLQGPSSTDFRRLVKLNGGRALRERYSAWELRDVTAVGAVVTAEVTAKVQVPGDAAGKPCTIDKWPLRVQMLRTPRGLEVVRLMPAGQPDLGWIDDQFVYHNDRLQVELVPPPSVNLTRTMDDMAHMQVLCRRTTDQADAASVSILGYFASVSPPEQPEAIRYRFTLGAEKLNGGIRVPGSRKDPVGPKGEHLGNSEDWVFGQSGGFRCRRERWTSVQVGMRHFLIKCVATGIDSQEAEARFTAAQDWFRTMLQSIRIRG